MRESISNFDLEAAFKALDSIDVPKARKGIAANRVDLNETFKLAKQGKHKTDVLIEEYYDISDKAELEQAHVDRADEIAKAKLARIEKIVDLDAETADDLLNSYADRRILQCPNCQLKIYKKPEEVEFSETDETIANEGEACPQCGNDEGWTVMGKVAPITDDERAKYTGEVESEESEENAEEFDFDAAEEAEDVSDEEPTEEESKEPSEEELPDLGEESEEEPEEEKNESLSKDNQYILTEAVTDGKDIIDEICKATDWTLKHTFLDDDDTLEVRLTKDGFSADITFYKKKNLWDLEGITKADTKTDLANSSKKFRFNVVKGIAKILNNAENLKEYEPSDYERYTSDYSTLLADLAAATDWYENKQIDDDENEYSSKLEVNCGAGKFGADVIIDKNKDTVLISIYKFNAPEKKGVTTLENGEKKFKLTDIKGMVKFLQNIDKIAAEANYDDEKEIDEACKEKRLSEADSESLQEAKITATTSDYNKMFDSKEFRTPVSDSEIRSYLADSLNNKITEDYDDFDDFDDDYDGYDETDDELFGYDEDAFISDAYYYINHLGYFDVLSKDKADTILAGYDKYQAKRKNGMAVGKELEVVPLPDGEYRIKIKGLDIKEGLAIDCEECPECPECQEVEITDFDEDSFNECVESYLKEVYDNVKNFELTSIFESDDGMLTCKGNILFNSEKIKPTIFKFNPTEEMNMYEGSNEEFASCPIYKIKFKELNKTAITESFSYAYKINESLVRGKIKSTRK